MSLQGFSVTLIVNFSSETIQATRQWDDIFKGLKEKDYQPRTLYLTKLSFKNEGKQEDIPR